MARSKACDISNLDLKAVGESFSDMRARPAHEWIRSQPKEGNDAIIESYLERRDPLEIADRFEIKTHQVVQILEEAGVI
jgi:hypothetical protein